MVGSGAEEPINEPLVELTTASTQFEADLLVAQLEDAGVRAVSGLDRTATLFGPPLAGGSVPVLVVRSQADAAREVLGLAHEGAPRALAPVTASRARRAGLIAGAVLLSMMLDPIVGPLTVLVLVGSGSLLAWLTR